MKGGGGGGGGGGEREREVFDNYNFLYDIMAPKLMPK